MKGRSAMVLRLPVLLGLSGLMLTLACGERTVELDQDFQKMLTYTFGDSREPLAVVQEKARQSYGKPDERLAVERQLAQLIRSESTFECKDFACRQLRVVGTKASVKTLASLLLDEKLSDSARYALEVNTDPSVDKELVKALKTAQGKTLIGILNTLGERRKAENAPSVEPFVANADAEVASAAKDALAKMAAGG